MFEFEQIIYKWFVRIRIPRCLPQTNGIHYVKSISWSYYQLTTCYPRWFPGIAESGKSLNVLQVIARRIDRYIVYMNHHSHFLRQWRFVSLKKVMLHIIRSFNRILNFIGEFLSVSKQIKNYSTKIKLQTNDMAPEIR